MAGSEPRHGMITERNVPARMRDGTTLFADVYRPDAEGRFPVLLLRLPYGKQFISDFGDHEYFVPRGYVVVIQDTRGRFESEGEYYALIHEPRDGYDTVEWAAGLPWSDGRDRKSTRLNSSHANISYAVFCLKQTTRAGLSF